MKPVRLLLLVLILLLPAIAPAKETKDVPFSFKNAEPVIFSHDVHLGIYKNNCRICHNAIFDIRKKTRFTMADMEKTILRRLPLGYKGVQCQGRKVLYKMPQRQTQNSLV